MRGTLVFMKPISPLLCLFVLIATTGCQQRVASKLAGEWVGQPDTADGRSARDAEKYGDQSAGQPTDASTKPRDASRVSDWENYDVTVEINFQTGNRLEMSLADGDQPRTGRWTVVSTAPTSCIIEVVTEPENTTKEAPDPVRRRFELLLDERDGECVGFTMTEVGADRLQGAMYFQRR